MDYGPTDEGMTMKEYAAGMGMYGLPFMNNLSVEVVKALHGMGYQNTI